MIFFDPLSHLDCSYNNIITLPSEICSLVHLRTLLLQHNKLTNIPNEIGNLTNLTSLKLHDNMIGTLPESIGNLTNLVELYPFSAKWEVRREGRWKWEVK